MKKFFLFIAAIALMLPNAVRAEDIFNHLGVGAHVATTGFGFEVASPITKYVTARAGVTIMPGITFNTDVEGYFDTGYGDQEFEMKLKGNLSRVQGSLIFNVYPFPSKTFYVAAGAYFGGSKVIKITGHSDEIATMSNDNPYVEVGEYKLPVDKNGNVDGGIKVNGFRPYFGIGFGRPVPKHRISVSGELGVQLHGTPKLYTNIGELEGLKEASDDDFQDIMDKLTVYPVLKITINGRIF